MSDQVKPSAPAPAPAHAPRHRSKRQKASIAAPAAAATSSSAATQGKYAVPAPASAPGPAAAAAAAAPAWSYVKNHANAKSSAPAPAPAPAPAAKSYSIDTSQFGPVTYPERWKNSDFDPEFSIRNLLDDWEERQDSEAASGFTSQKIVSGEYGSRYVEPVLMHQPLARIQPELASEANVEFIVMKRIVYDGAEDAVEPFPGQFVTHNYNGKDKSLDKVVHIRVPRADVEGMMEKGWCVSFAPAAKYDLGDQYKDSRPRPDPPVDRFTTDKPAADILRFLEDGSKIMATAWTSKKWEPGDMLGPDGADPAVKAKTASLIPHENWEDWRQGDEMRSITSVSHVYNHPRPHQVGVGWGDYDRFDCWQSYGRHVKYHMVPRREWSKVVHGPLQFFNEDGTRAESFRDVFAGTMMPPTGVEPMPLQDFLNPMERNEQKQQKYGQKPAAPTTPAAASVPGPSNLGPVQQPAASHDSGNIRGDDFRGRGSSQVPPSQ